MGIAEYVLVVDDDEDSRNVVVELLQGAGYSATAAPGGAAALRIMAEGVPALVLSDLVMRGMDGQELLSRSRQLLGASMPPFVFLTGLPAKLAHVSEPVLSKPYHLHELLEVVGHYC